MRDAKETIVIYCARGNRSALAADTLQQMGYENVSSMADGFGAWIAIEGPGRGLAVPGDASTLIDHPTFRRLRHALATRPAILAPDDGAPRRAAVALVLRRTADDVVELLLIKRSEREDDPWSGHVALPGGRRDPSDATLQDTAIRETLEETGIDLARDGDRCSACSTSCDHERRRCRRSS